MQTTADLVNQGMSSFQRKVSASSSAGGADLADYERRAEQADRLIAQLTERLGQLEAALAAKGGAPIVAAPAAGVAWPQNDHKEWQSKTVADKTKSDAKPAKEDKKEDNKKDKKDEKAKGGDKKEKKDKKPPRVKIAKSDVYIEVMPDTEVEDFSWDNIEKDVRAMRINGLLWAAGAFAQVDFVFGLKKMLVVCQIVDNMVESTAPVVEAIKKIKGVSECEMVSIQTAQDDWDPENKRSMIAGAASQAASDKKKGGKKGGDGKKKDKKGKKQEGPRTVTDDMIKQSAQKICVAAKEAEYYVAGVTECDGSGQTDVSKEQFLKVDKIVREKVPDCVLFYIGAGNTAVTALVTVPAAKKGKVDAIAFLNSTMVPADAKESTTECAYGAYKCDAEKGDFPIKIKDQVNGMAFQYLRSSGLLVESDDDGEDYFLSDL